MQIYIFFFFLHLVQLNFKVRFCLRLPLCFILSFCYFNFLDFFFFHFIGFLNLLSLVIFRYIVLVLLNYDFIGELIDVD